MLSSFVPMFLRFAPMKMVVAPMKWIFYGLRYCANPSTLRIMGVCLALHATKKAQPLGHTIFIGNKMPFPNEILTFSQSATRPIPFKSSVACTPRALNTRIMLEKERLFPLSNREI